VRPLSILWVVDFDYSTRLHHGNVIRFVNYSRELLIRGHRVYVVTDFDAAYRDQSQMWFSSLKDKGIISGFFELSYSPVRWRSWLAARAMYPGIVNWILRAPRCKLTVFLERLIANLGVDIVLISSRRMLFLTATLSSSQPRLVDFCDCVSLYLAREIRHLVRNKYYWRSFCTFPYFLNVLNEDRYYARRSAANIVVSPADNRALARVAGSNAKIYTLLNGVDVPPECCGADKIRNRLIFSGNMDFPPNYTGALWFLDHVFPLVVQHVPDVHLVLAGANPPDFIRGRASDRVAVTGYVQDLNREIARSALYVAPMQTGSGFKNKVVEAIVNHTYVVATSMAVEFLDPSTRSLIAVADSPQGMADTIVTLLRDPDTCRDLLSKLYSHISSTFTWSARADELLQIIEETRNEAITQQAYQAPLRH